jgi:hypothetical protein
MRIVVTLLAANASVSYEIRPATSAKLLLHESALLVPAARIKPGCNRAAGMKQSHQGRIKMGGKKIPMPGGGGGA